MRLSLPAILVAGLLSGCTPRSAAPADSAAAAPVTTPSGLQYVVLQEGSGDQPREGQAATIHYTVRLADGTDVETTRTGEPAVFVLGTHAITPGLEEAVRTMRVGERREVTIPPALGYGAEAVGPIPANSTLVMDVELLRVDAKPPAADDHEGHGH